jgi:hypothetical protein
MQIKSVYSSEYALTALLVAIINNLFFIGVFWLICGDIVIATLVRVVLRMILSDTKFGVLYLEKSNAEDKSEG